MYSVIQYNAGAYRFRILFWHRIAYKILILLSIVSTIQSKSEKTNHLINATMNDTNHLSVDFYLSTCNQLFIVVLKWWNLEMEMSKSIWIYISKKYFSNEMKVKHWTTEEIQNARHNQIITLLQVNQFDCPENIKMKRHSSKVNESS